MKTAERDMARMLRREEGLSIREIERRLGVARSSVSVWVRDIELTPEQEAALLTANPNRERQRAGNEAWSATCRARRRAWQDEGRAAARRGDPLHAAGCMLYWAEGSKGRNSVQLTNADPEVLVFFVGFLRRHFQVPDARITVTCNVFADHVERLAELERFWLERLGLPRSSLRKSIVNRYSKYSQRKRTNMLRYGTARVAVHSTAILQHIFGAIQEYGGFERPEWLD